MIRVVLIDDHAVVRTGLRIYLESEGDMEVVGEGCDGEEVVPLVTDLNPDVVLMDLLMPKVSGIEALGCLREAKLRCPVVILTSSLEDEKIVQALRLGAMSYVLKSSSAQHVVRALRDAVAGISVFDSNVQQKLMGGLLLQTQSAAPEADLTERERDVLRCIASGQNNQEIAEHLGIGIKTVKTHVSNVLLKLAVMDRTQAAIYAIRHQLD